MFGPAFTNALHVSMKRRKVRQIKGNKHCPQAPPKALEWEDGHRQDFCHLVLGSITVTNRLTVGDRTAELGHLRIQEAMDLVKEATDLANCVSMLEKKMVCYVMII